MTDQNSTPVDDSADEFYDDVADTFPRKEDFEDRLVAIWVTGKHGTRKSEATGEPYGWVETITMALDDGSDGTKGQGKASDGDDFLVGPAPAFAEPFQWSAEGMYTRLFPRIRLRNAEDLPDYRPAIGRINRRKNSKRGFNDSWSIGKPTEADRPIVRQYADKIRAMTAHVQELREEDLTGEAFS